MLAAIAFLTPLPVGAGRRPSGRTLLWFPVVGALLGGVLGLTWRGVDRLTRGQGLLVATVVVVADLALTGALHFDGLVDSADGLFAPVERARRLAIMASPEIGAFGLAAGAMALLLRVASLAQSPPRPLLLIGLWCASRTVMACVAAALPYARSEGGTASAFLEGMPEALVIGIPGILLAMVAASGAGLRGVVAVSAGLLAALGVAMLARLRIGGFTGDVLGACGFVCETVGLVVASVR
ncbi:MAG: adenosylcobinamide-GDP ribazoletransferase [Acidimicrobiales bacterium]